MRNNKGGNSGVSITRLFFENCGHLLEPRAAARRFVGAPGAMSDSPSFFTSPLLLTPLERVRERAVVVVVLSCLTFFPT